MICHSQTTDKNSVRSEDGLLKSVSNGISVEKGKVGGNAKTSDVAQTWLVTVSSRRRS
jgi:hypothetical protein